MSAARTAHQQSLSRCVIIYDDNLSYRSLYIFFFIFFFLSLFERKTVATYCATCCERFKMCLLNENHSPPIYPDNLLCLCMMLSGNQESLGEAAAASLFALRYFISNFQKLEMERLLNFVLGDE